MQGVFHHLHSLALSPRGGGVKEMRGKDKLRQKHGERERERDREREHRPSSQSCCLLDVGVLLTETSLGLEGEPEREQVLGAA